MINKTRADIADLLEKILGEELEAVFVTTSAKLESELQFLRESGQKEYTHADDNAFGNFERLANMLELDRKSILFVYAAKHLDGIVSYLRGHKSQREDIRGRINDVIVYLVLLRGMVDQEEGK